MSYNITTWKTKKIENLVIPLASFKIHERGDFHPEISQEEDGLTITYAESEITGLKQEDSIFVTNIEISGEASGTFYNEVFRPALLDSEGTMEAVIIWEGGDSITRLSVTETSVFSEPIEL